MTKYTIMGEVYFIGDTHFGHKNILTYEPYARPFANIDEHNEHIITQWNSVVTKRDTVFHLGDFCMGRGNIHIAGRLNGLKRLVMGNHDVYGAAEYLQYFHSLHGMIFYKEFVLSHMPCRADQGRSTANIHGHLHSKRIDDDYYINVSCEQINLTPIHIDEIRDNLNKARGI